MKILVFYYRISIVHDYSHLLPVHQSVDVFYQKVRFGVQKHHPSRFRQSPYIVKR